MIAFLSLMLLVLARLTPLFLFGTLTPFAWVPGIVRVTLACATALMVALAVGPQGPLLDPSHPWAFAFALAREMATGTCLAFAVMIPGAALAFSARLVDAQSGIAAAELLNPVTRSTESLVGTLMRWASAMIFFSAGLYRDALHALVASFNAAPPGDARMLMSLDRFTSVVSSQFVIGFIVVMPVVTALFAIDIGIGYVSRSMPQANIYFVALPLKLAAALVLLAMTLRATPGAIEAMYHNALSAVAGGGI
jgi:flagellar biosynthesis protein FliR